MMAKRSFLKRVQLRYWVLLAYLCLLCASHIARFFQPNEGPLLPEQTRITLDEYNGSGTTGSQIEFAYRHLKPEGKPAAPVLVLIHGNPMASSAMDNMIEHLRNDFELVVPDLAGFGGSTLSVKNYSNLTQAHYLKALLDHLTIRKAYFLGYSQGGGVILRYADKWAEEVESLTMLAAIGVQELELLGDYTLNHGLYGVEYGLIWLLQEAVPHFGYMDDSLLNLSHVRNFWDSDQRPLRKILKEYEKPMLIIHGEQDFFVPLAAAEEHARIVPQSELKLMPQGHMLPFGQADEVATTLKTFLSAVSTGSAKTRSSLPETEQEAALEPMPLEKARANEGSRWLYMGLIILGSQLAEDLACIVAGLMVSRGVIDYVSATLACLVGIFIGDMLLYLAGRYLGRPATRRAPLKWFLKEKDVTRAEAWFNKKGATIIVASRFIPGSRLPAYFTAGVARIPIKKFIFYFVAAAAVWSPILVGASYFMGDVFLSYFEAFEANAWVGVLGIVAFFLFINKLLIPSFSHRGRRLLLSAWRRWVRWEFWPMWLFYPPVLFKIFYLGIKHRSATLFTAVNPAMPASGFIEESKSDILTGLGIGNEAVAQWTLVAVNKTLEEKLSDLDAFQKTHALGFPIVLKPDVGQRGEGVAVIDSMSEARDFLERCPEDVIIQEYIPGEEYGVFYYRYPHEESGHIFGITTKYFTSVQGDGKQTLENLILNDERAVCMAKFFLNKHADHLDDVPEKDENVKLVELGTHCRGSIFKDGNDLITDALSKRIDEISKGYDGFYFGRYDIKVPSAASLAQGKELKILELNGVTSEATFIYDPKNSVFTGWKVLFRQWQIAFEIAAENKKNGAEVTSPLGLLKLYLQARTKTSFEA